MELTRIGAGKGVSFGVPWKRGELMRGESLSLCGKDGEAIKMHSRNTAYWNDGSVKWTAHSASIPVESESGYFLQKGVNGAAGGCLSVEQSDRKIIIDTGALKCEINRISVDSDAGSESGENKSALIGQISDSSGNVICSGADLIFVREKRSESDGARSYTHEDFTGLVTDTSVEEYCGGVCAVVKIDGIHERKNERLLPFTVRLYFYTDSAEIRMLHTFFYDGDAHKDYIKGLGVVFHTRVRGELYNRHVKIAKEESAFCDSAKNLDVWRARGKYVDMFKKQIAGEYIGFNPTEDKNFLMLLDESAVWNDFKILQHSARGFDISKRTHGGCSYVTGYTGGRALGAVYAGGANGGLAIGLRYFWEKYPSELEVSGLARDESKITVWLWPPDCNAQDLRHYDTETHVQSGYEGFDEMRSTPYGIANTNEILIALFERTPTDAEFPDFSDRTRHPARLVCTPEYYCRTGAIVATDAREDTADNVSDFRQRLENELDEYYNILENEIEKRNWYGFWNYGDMMRAYDSVRDLWKYDVGGFAWNNNEFDPNIWLWQTFFRTGSAEVFGLAEAFTRHACEVDQYHFGEYAGLGSRHNVMHWGCGCKEARISMALLHKYYFYLTGDARTGDILDEVRDADLATVEMDPMRAYFTKTGFVTHTRVSPDWAAFVSNWVFQWERYEDEKYLRKILTGIECLSKMPYRLCSGPTYGYDPATGILSHMGDNNSSYHMMNCFAGPLAWIELDGLIENESWRQMLIEYARFYMLPDEEKLKQRPDMPDCRNWSMPEGIIALASFAANKSGDAEFAKKVREFVETERTEHKTAALNSGMALRCISLIACLKYI